MEYSNIDDLDASFVIIRKNASTSILAALYSHKHNIEYSSLNFPINVNATDIYSCSKDRVLLNSFKFIALRDPFERLLSGFIHKIIKHPHKEGKDYFKYQPDYAKYSKDIPKAFDMFLSFLEQADFANIDEHFAFQHDLGRFNDTFYDKIIRVETLENDWKDLQSKIKLPNLPRHKIHSSGSENYLGLLKPIFYDRVFKLYECDFIL